MGIASLLRKAPRWHWRRHWNEPGLAGQRALLERCAAALRAGGLETLPYRDPSLPVLRAKRDPAQAIAYFERYVQALEETIAAGESPRDTPKLLWRFMNLLGLRPPSDAFGHITAEDVVEIYTTTDHIQVFRNLRFFDFCSFTVEEVVHCSWTTAVSRPAQFKLKLLGTALKLRTGLMRSTLNAESMGENLVHEEIGEGRYVMLKLRYLSPLWSMDHPRDQAEPRNANHVLVIERVRPAMPDEIERRAGTKRR
jgi:hypothetical protein